MARKKAVLQLMAEAQREQKKHATANLRAQHAATREAERARREYERAAKAMEKEQARLYTEARAAEVEAQNQQLAEYITDLEQILVATLSKDDYFDLDTLKEAPLIPPFNPGSLETPGAAPSLDQFLPPAPSRLGRLVPGAKDKHEQLVAVAQKEFEAATTKYEESEALRRQELERARQRYGAEAKRIRARVAEQHEDVERLKRDVAGGVPPAVSQYFSLVLETSEYPDGFPHETRVAYVPESKQLVVELELPSVAVIPEAAEYRYVKTKDEITQKPRSKSSRQELFSSVIAQITIRTLHELYEADRDDLVDSIVLNGFVDTIDPGTGQAIQPYLVTVRATREQFSRLDLRHVEPKACLATLNASVSKNPTELSPVRPVLEFSMVDPRFIEEVDVLSSLDHRPNLMELTPGEFESLISNLFQKMGLETRLTQASRDGGVDCVAFDPRPIFGGKVVIQAKRYKDTVGVSAVRDLFGTVQNEGASKGILVTTSGFGSAAYEFAAGKPLELLSGSHLLHLLEEHAGIEARIIMPVV